LGRIYKDTSWINPESPAVENATIREQITSSGIKITPKYPL
jgi:hypothetical protein